ncbi:MAG: DUF4080 domain-containing protein [Rikenellaceae bacterium]|jgi:radical SAM superfamily enzyme YgiQ (UPF0313 family)|nr:DUF4080 domain-containing protein [Rikenellaceae bacterium]
MNQLLWLDLNSSYAHASLALPAIHAQCGDEQARWSVVSATLSTPIGAVVSQIVERNPDILAATAWLFTRETLFHIIKRVKALLPHCLIVLGGPEFLGDNEACLRQNPEIDALFRGEGEVEFPRWLATAHDRAGWSTIAGLCFLDGEGTYRDGGTARVADFAGLRLPEASRFFRWDKPFVQVETARGCFNRCAFCVSGAEKPVRTMPVERVRGRIEAIRERGIREIRLLDRTFNGHWPRAVALLNLFAEFPEMRFHLEIHPACLTDEIRAVLRALPTGLLHLEAGIQSLRQPVLDACQRTGSLPEALDGLRFLCSQANLTTHADLLVGLPLYPLEALYEDIFTLAELGADEIQLELLKLLPGTAMRRDAEALGLVYSPLPPYEVLKTNAMSVDDVQTGRLLSRLLDGYYNARAWQAVTRRLILSEPGFLADFLRWMRPHEWLDQPLSVEKRGLLLFRFVAEKYPDRIVEMADHWMRAGLSPRKIKDFIKEV